MPHTAKSHSQSHDHAHSRPSLILAHPVLVDVASSHFVKTDSFAHSLADHIRPALAQLLLHARNFPARTAVSNEEPAVELAPLAPSSSRARTRATASDDTMKFSQSLLFNAVPDWLNNYIA